MNWNRHVCSRGSELVPNRAVSAFTLIELMVVLAVIAITAVVIIPEMRGTFNDALLRSTARQLIHACEATSSRAITLNQPQRLQIDPRQGRYYLERPRPGIGASEWADAPSAPALARQPPPIEGQLDSRVHIEFAESSASGQSLTGEPMNAESSDRRSTDDSSEPGQVLTFFPDGTAQGPAVILQDREGFRLRLTIHPVTARIHLLELPRPLTQ